MIRHRRVAIAMTAAFLSLLTGCGGDPDDVTAPVLPAVETSGGATTTFDSSTDAFAKSAANLDSGQRAAFAVGNAFFNDNWVVAPASTDGRDGLGPVFNAFSCSGCHLHDGRAQPPTDSSSSPGLLLRLSVPGTGEHGEPIAEPTYGGQLQDHSIPGVPVEGTVVIEHTTVSGAFADGSPYTLDRPTYRVAGNLGPLAPDVLVSPRVAPAIVGMGLLEAVPDAAVLARADPTDADGDGISGRPNSVWDAATGSMALGRFGWKAGQPSVRQQVAAAFAGDIGITSGPIAAQPCTAAETVCAAAADGGTPELSADKLDRVVFYSRTIGVPAHRDVDDPTVVAGAQTFAQLGCSSCHTPTLTTGDSDVDALSTQDIHPYTDLLLHDMGPELADGRPEYAATGNEWRTAPLWGLGLVETVNGHTRFLHDGRARTIEEAILWHGGEAQIAQTAYTFLDADERAALLAFLRSL